MKLKNVWFFISNPIARFDILSSRGVLNWMDDETYLKRYYKLRMGKELNLDNPQTFNEKLQWLKLHDRKDIYTTMVDKYEVKKYVADIIGEKYIIPTLGVWNKFDNIDFDSLPDQFVLKCTHDSGGLIIVRDKSKLDINLARKKINKCLKRNYYTHGREWPYKNVRPRIIAEKYMEEAGASKKGEELKDYKSLHLDNISYSVKPDHNLNVYKIFTFDGEPYLIQVIQDDKTKNESIDYFDLNWNLLEMRQSYPNSERHLKRPSKLGEMLELTSRLSNRKPFIRVDFYEINGIVYFSEFTFYSDAGFEPFYPDSWDSILGAKIKI